MRLLLFLTGLIFCEYSQSQSQFISHLPVIIRASQHLAITGRGIEYPFISSLNVEKESLTFSKSSGIILQSYPKVAYSAYDSAIKYDISSFYNSKNSRIKFIINYVEPSSEIYISVGYDSGSQAEKINISRAYFIGLTRTFNIHKNGYLTTSSGSWFGGKITQYPCIDSYNREYYCPNLTAWIDRPNLHFQNEKYFQINYVSAF